MKHYPDTKKEPVVETIHTVVVTDSYRWLEDSDSPRTKEWIAHQNAYSEAYFNSLLTRKEYKKRISELLNFQYYSAVQKKAGRYFLLGKNGLQNQSVLSWTHDLSNPPTVLIDPNLLSNDGTTSIAGYSVSTDGIYCAYALSHAGSDWQTWSIRHVESGKDMPEVLEWTKFTEPVWTPDNNGFFYTSFQKPSKGDEYKEKNVHQSIFYHRIGSAQSEDLLIYSSDEHQDCIYVLNITDDAAFLIITLLKGTQKSNAVFFKSVYPLISPVKPLIPDFSAQYSYCGSSQGTLYFLTDSDACNGRVIAIDFNDSGKEAYREIIPESNDVLCQAHFIGNTFFATYIHDVHHRVLCFTKQGSFQGSIALPGKGTVEGFHGKGDDTETFYIYSDFTHPPTAYHYELATAESALIFKPTLPFDPSQFESRQYYCASKDGTSVPLCINGKKDIQKSPKTPVLLYGYGGFTISITPFFSVLNILWMELGGLSVIATIRGGGEFGDTWYKAGIKKNKQNVFDDFCAAAQWLSDEKFTTPEKIAIHGRSNGGLLVGACLTQKPALFGACLCCVGVLDMVRFHLFTIGRAWISDYGSPENKDEFDALIAYSPYHAVKEGAHYPATLICTGDHDDRVFPAHSYKFAAALQAAQAADNPILIRIQKNAGHGRLTATSALIEELSDSMTFIWDALHKNYHRM